MSLLVRDCPDLIVCHAPLEHYKSVGIVKEPSWKCKQKVKWIHEQPCIITGRTGDEIDAHHVVFRSMDNLCTDYLLVPLTHWIHIEELHNGLGVAGVEKKYKVNFFYEAIKTAERFTDHLLQLTKNKRTF
jgi:hypothetical protein